MIDGARGHLVPALALVLFVCFAIAVHIAVVDGSRVPAVGAGLCALSIAAFGLLLVALAAAHPFATGGTP